MTSRAVIVSLLRHSVAWSLVAALAGAAVACSSVADGADAGAADASTDGVIDAAAADAAVTDALDDAAPDDAAPDAPDDAATDASADAAPDDAAIDAPPDDAAPDAAPDATPDAGSPDAALDAASDARNRDELEPIYSYPGVGPQMCGVGIDHATRTNIDDLIPLLDDAVAYGAVLHLFAHRPRETVTTARLEAVFRAARDRGLRFVTYAELASGTVDGAGLAFAFDDAHVDAWTALRPMLDRYQARVTFFLTRYPTYDQLRRDQVRVLAADGHDIQFHGAAHRHAIEYVAQHGLAAYLADEIDVGMAAMRADGYEPTVFAYPFGEHTDRLDQALLQRFTLLRAIRATCTR